MKVVFCIPTLVKPFAAMLDALEKSIPLVIAAGWQEASCWEVGSAYVSWARASLAEKALRYGADVIVYIDHDLSWEPEDLLTLIETPGDVVAGTYRFKEEPEKYMGRTYPSDDGRAIMREDGAIRMAAIPAGFLKITRRVVEKVRSSYPELVFDNDEPRRCFTDLFHHGAHNGIWFGEDYAFCRRWLDLGEQIWCVPTLKIDHHTSDGAVYRGDYHDFLLRQPGGSKYQEAA